MTFFKDYTKNEMEEFLASLLAKVQAIGSERPVLTIVFSFCLGYVCALLGKFFFALLLLAAVFGIAIYLALPDKPNGKSFNENGLDREGSHLGEKEKSE